MIVADLVDDAKENLDLLSLAVAVLGFGLAAFGSKLLDKRHRRRPQGWLAIGLAGVGLVVVGSELAVMFEVGRDSITNRGGFEPVLLFHDVLFLVFVGVFIGIVILLIKAISYTRKAGS